MNNLNSQQYSRSPQILADNLSFVREDSMATVPGSRLSGLEGDYRTQNRIGGPISEVKKSGLAKISPKSELRCDDFGRGLKTKFTTSTLFRKF